MTTAITTGTRVAYARSFLQATGQYTGPERPTSYGPFARGVVIPTAPGPLNTPALATVRWDDSEISVVATAILVREDRLHLEFDLMNMPCRKTSPAVRSAPARALADRKFRQRIVRNRKLYTRKGRNGERP